MNDFLPKDYSVPKSEGTNFMKLESGENRIRFLSAPVMGWELWVGGKPKRIHMQEIFSEEEKKNADINKFSGKPRPPAHFWMMAVWNYKEKTVQILQVNQATIQNAIMSLVNDADWGKPFDYDIVINRNGEGKEVEYLVNPKPHKPVEASIKQAYDEKAIDLGAVYTNGTVITDLGSNSEVIDPKDVPVK